MDGSAAIERNRAALKRIVASLIDMAGLAEGGEVEPASPATLPRHLYLFILRLLRPAEAAARRLIIAAARGLVVPPPKAPRKTEPKPETTEPILRKLGLAVMVSPADRARAAILPRVRGRGTAEGGGGGAKPAGRLPAFPLFDPPRRLLLGGRTRRRYTPPHAAPRICVPGFTELRRLPPPPSPDDPIDAVRLCRRIAALAAALDDLPGQARRFARRKARLDAGLEQRSWPLRRGRPPGGRLSRWDPDACRDGEGAQGRRSPRNIREIDEILAHTHALAVYALENPDTS